MHKSNAESDSHDSSLGFSYRVRKDCAVEILHHGRVATTLRGSSAQDFLAEAPEPASADAQQLMARLTGNYRRGNEHVASSHPRNLK